MAWNLLNGDIVEVIAWQNYNQQTILNVLHYKLETASSIADGVGEVDGLVGKLTDAVGAESIRKQMRLAQVDGLVHERWSGQLVYPIRRPIQFTPVNVAGVIVEAGLPQNVAATITKQPDLPGRGRSGSFHMAGAPASANALGEWDAIWFTNLQPIADKIKANVPTIAAGGTWRPVIWSGKTPTVSREVFNAFAQETIRVQRRRTVRLGI